MVEVSEIYIKDIKYLEEKIQLIEYIEQLGEYKDFFDVPSQNAGAPFEYNEIKTLDYFMSSLSDIKNQAQEVYSQDKSSFGTTIAEHKLLNDIEHLKFYINQYFNLKGNKALTQMHMQTYQKQLDDIVSDMDKMTPQETNEQLGKFLEKFSKANLNNSFANSIINSKIISIILKSIEMQISKGKVKQIDLSLVTKYGIEEELFHSIKSLILEKAKTQEKDEQFSYLELFENLNINELTDPQLWNKIFGIDNAEILVAKPTEDNKNISKLDSTENEPILRKLQEALSTKTGLYKIFKVLRNSNIKYRIGIVADIGNDKKKYKSIGIPFTFSRFKKLIQNCDTMYTFATKNEDTGEYENIDIDIEFGNLNDFKYMPLKRCDQIVELVINAKLIPCTFTSCKNLKTVNILDNVAYIPKSTFFSCGNLTYVTLGNNIKHIGNSAFSGTDIEEITIPDSTETLGEEAFYHCDRLKTAHLGNGIETIGNNCFCKTPIEEITIPDSTETLGEGAFFECSKLKNVHLGNGIETIGDNCFYKTPIEEITIPDSTEKLGAGAFYHCDRLKTAHLGNGIITIGDACFKFAIIREITIPNSTKILGEDAFYCCDILKTVHLGNSIKIIGDNCFSETLIEEITIPDNFTVNSFFIKRVFGNTFPSKIYTNNYIKFDGFDNQYCNRDTISINTIHIEIIRATIGVSVDEKDRAAEIVANDIANYTKKDQVTR